MKKTISLLLCAAMLAAMLLSMSACGIGEMVDYNAVAESVYLPFGPLDFVSVSYNEEGQPLCFAKTDRSFSATGESSLTYQYDLVGDLLCLVATKDGKSVTMSITEKTESSVSAAAASLSVVMTLDADGHVTEQVWSKDGACVATLLYNEEARPVSVTLYENETEISASYTYTPSKVCMQMSYYGSAVSYEMSYGANGIPASLSGTASDASDGESFQVSGTWGNAMLSYLFRASGDKGSDLRYEYAYTYGVGGSRAKETATSEYYTSQALTYKTVEEWSYDILGYRTEYAKTEYENGILATSKLTERYDTVGNVELSTKTLYNTQGKCVHYEEIAYANQSITAKTTVSYDEEGVKTEKQALLYTYAATGECSKTDLTVYDANDKAKTRTICEYDMFGNVLTREEITYVYLLGILSSETYKKYDASGNLLDEGFRKSDS